MPEASLGRGTSDIYDLIEFNADVFMYNYYSFCMLMNRFSNVLWTTFAFVMIMICLYFYKKLNKIKKVPKDDRSRSPHRQSMPREVQQSPHRSQSRH